MYHEHWVVRYRENYIMKVVHDHMISFFTRIVASLWERTEHPCSWRGWRHTFIEHVMCGIPEMFHANIFHGYEYSWKWRVGIKVFHHVSHHPFFKKWSNDIIWKLEALLLVKKGIWSGNLFKRHSGHVRRYQVSKLYTLGTAWRSKSRFIY